MFNRKGFGLVQLIVVMAVLAILVGLAVPKIMGHTQEAQLTRLLYDARLLEDACHRYYIDNQDWPRGEGPLDESDLTDVVYTIIGEEASLDPSEANYYRIDMVALNDYVRIRSNPLNYVLQNPIGSIYTLDPKTNPALVEQGRQVEVYTWTQTFGGSGDDRAYSVQQTTNGGCIIAGNATSYGAGGCDVYLIKIDTQGNQEWYKTFGGSSIDHARSVQQTIDGGYIIAGCTNSYGAGDYDVYLIKTDSQGNQEWYKTFGGSSSDFAYSVQQISDGGYIIAGYTKSYGAGYYDAYLIKTDSQGNLEWYKTFGGSGYECVWSVQQTTDGGYIIAGCTNSYGAGGCDVYLIKTDAQGNQEWCKTFGGSGDDRAYSVQQTSDGGYIISGYTNSYGAGGYDVYLIKTDAQGNVE